MKRCSSIHVKQNTGRRMCSVTFLTWQHYETQITSAVFRQDLQVTHSSISGTARKLFCSLAGSSWFKLWNAINESIISVYSIQCSFLQLSIHSYLYIQLFYYGMLTFTTHTNPKTSSSFISVREFWKIVSKISHCPTYYSTCWSFQQFCLFIFVSKSG